MNMAVELLHHGSWYPITELVQIVIGHISRDDRRIPDFAASIQELDEWRIEFIAN